MSDLLAKCMMIWLALNAGLLTVVIGGLRVRRVWRDYRAAAARD
jgi:hypothetical protein